MNKAKARAGKKKKKLHKPRAKKDAGKKKVVAPDKKEGRKLQAISDDGSYEISTEYTSAKVQIAKKEGENIATYNLKTPEMSEGTLAFLDDLRGDFLKKATITKQEALDIRMAEQLREKFTALAKKMVAERMPHMSPEDVGIISEKLVNEMLGLGDLEFLLKDDWIEEICINGCESPVWIYHRKYGWVKSNIVIPDENQIWNYSSAIARRIGRQISTQSPLLDAYLPTGDRVNATLMPISSFGNTITIRKFARKAWTITDLIKANTISLEAAALIWLATQYEMNIIISGGTGAGKTSMLNVVCSFIPENQRVVSIEQTREITAPKYLQWVPLVVREATGEGKGGVNMLDLLVNSLRMRPDRIIVGEIRRAEEAEVLFEAMHTGHSVYATLHAETVDETLRRLTHPPINIPTVMMESLHLIVTMYRDRRSGRRRMFELGEIVPGREGEEIKANTLYKWDSGKDKIAPVHPSKRVMDAIKIYTNMSDSEIKKNLAERREILNWLVKEDINDVDAVGKIIAQYYDDPKAVVAKVHGK